MHATRDVAARLADLGVIEITQRGVAVSPRGFKGPIRLRLKAVSEVKGEPEPGVKRTARPGAGDVDGDGDGDGKPAKAAKRE